MSSSSRLRSAGEWVGSFAVLLVFQLLGTGVVAITGISLPGPVIGLALLGLALVVGRNSKRHERWRSGVAPAADSLLELLPLLFVPAGVGVVAYLPLLNQYLAAVIIALVVSFVLTLLATGGLLQLLLRRFGKTP